MNTLRLIPEEGGDAIEITADHTRVGREPGSDVHLRNASVSRQHAIIEKNDDEWVITDRKSGNGVLIDGVRTAVGVLLPGQLLQLGTVCFRVEIDRGDDGSTVILDRSPFSDKDSTIIGAGSFERTAVGQGGADRSGRFSSALPIAAGVIGLAAIAALGLFLRSEREADDRAAALAEALSAMPTVTPPTPTPVPPTPTPTPVRRVVARPRGSLLISTDTTADVLVDGRRIGRLRAGRMRKVPVSPGEHIVSFRIGKTRHDRVVRVRARQQAAVRYRRVAPRPIPPASPPPAATPDLPPPEPHPALPFSGPGRAAPSSVTPQTVRPPTPAR